MEVELIVSRTRRRELCEFPVYCIAHQNYWPQFNRVLMQFPSFLPSMVVLSYSFVILSNEYNNNNFLHYVMEWLCLDSYPILDSSQVGSERGYGLVSGGNCCRMI